MKVLILSFHYLDDNSGGSFASRAFVNAFAALADSSKLMYPSNGKDIRQHIHQACELHPIVDKRSVVKKIVDVYRGILNRYENILPQIKAFDPDIIVFDNSRSSSGLIEPLKKLGKKIITIHHNYEIEYYKGTKPNILWRIPFMYFMEKSERTAVVQSDLNLCLTEQDAVLLHHHYAQKNDASIACVGCFESVGLELLKNNNNNEGHSDNLDFIISGNLSAYQTQIPLIHFLNHLYPILLNRFPNSQLTIAGRNPSQELIEICQLHPQIHLIPNPPSMQELIREAAVYICPVFLGGGLKLRIMDGLKAGLPILTHEISARGYDKFKEVGCLFAYEDEQSFDVALAKIQDLYKNGQFNKELIQKHYQNLFSFESGVQRIKKLIEGFE